MQHGGRGRTGSVPRLAGAARKAAHGDPRSRSQLPDETATRRLAAPLAGSRVRGDVIALWGDLGAGKTVLARAFVRARVGDAEEVPSPTFTLVQILWRDRTARRCPIWHFDLFRLNAPERPSNSASRMRSRSAITLIEWPERLGALLPPTRLDVTLAVGPGSGRGALAILGGARSWQRRLREAGLAAERRPAIDAFLAAAGWPGRSRARWPATPRSAATTGCAATSAGAVLMDAPPERGGCAAVRAHRPPPARRSASALPPSSRPTRAHGPAAAGGLRRRHLHPAAGDAGADEAALYASAVDVLIHLHRLPAAAALPAGLPAYDETPAARRGAAADRLVPAGGQRRARRSKTAARGLPRRVAGGRSPDALAATGDPGAARLPRRQPDAPGRGATDSAACGLLDFQDAVVGPRRLRPDVAARGRAARRRPAVRKAAMLARYLAGVAGRRPASVFARSFAVLAAQRHAKVIGIFTRLYRRDGKPAYLAHIPRVWRLLEAALAPPGARRRRAPGSSGTCRRRCAASSPPR